MAAAGSHMTQSCAVFPDGSHTAASDNNEAFALWQPYSCCKSAGRNFWAALISDEENREKSPSFSAVRVSLLLTGSLLTVLPTAHAADDDNTILGMSLPQVNNSAIGYGKSVDGAVSDKLFYTLGGGSVISQPAARQYAEAGAEYRLEQ